MLWRSQARQLGLRILRPASRKVPSPGSSPPFPRPKRTTRPPLLQLLLTGLRFDVAYHLAQPVDSVPALRCCCISGFALGVTVPLSQFPLILLLLLDLKSRLVNLVIATEREPYVGQWEFVLFRVRHLVVDAV